MHPGLQVLLACKQFESLDELVFQCVLLVTKFNRIEYNQDANMQSKRIIIKIQNEGIMLCYLCRKISIWKHKLSVSISCHGCGEKDVYASMY